MYITTDSPTMPPLQNISAALAPAPTTTIDFSPVREQWQNPSDILTILMVIGGDIVRSALAQLASSHPRPFIPVAFSFGWVAYAFSAILSAVGSHRLAPQPDCDCKLIDITTGYSRVIHSWNLARLVRDHKPQNDTQRGLTITFFTTSRQKDTGVPDRDWVYYTGLSIIISQLVIAVIPGALYGNWLILVLTVSGIMLTQVHGSVAQWRQELWGARSIPKGKREVVCLTKGNGSAFVIVIRSEGYGLRLADLAGAREVYSERTIWTTFALAVLWLVHLLTMQSVQDNSWFSLAIGFIGMLQNVVAAGVRRDPAALGFHLENRIEIHKEKVFAALQEAEKREPKVGLALLDIFFPGGLRSEEEAWKQRTISSYIQRG
ncbi:hypothetical protein VKT23_013180 [Stygiomarasmius scandens]|uniref:Uncharacterized protein n=1 Tax=Marasmiellus scandens TaxID=2682957 RepID=A0ABR1J4E1_9AGAR